MLNLEPDTEETRLLCPVVPSSNGSQTMHGLQDSVGLMYVQPWSSLLHAVGQ
jgi:hypothetical protein